MKTIKIIAAIVAFAAMFAGCNKDGEIVTLSVKDIEPVVLSGPDEGLVLSIDNAASLAMTLNWSDNGTLAATDADVKLPNNTIVNTLQFCADDKFENAIEQATDAGQISKQYTVDELNSLVTRLGFPGEVCSTLYIRVKSVLANNQDAIYSNVLNVSVTPYIIDMSKGIILNTANEDTGVRLYSAASDGVYSGFMGVASWYNFWMQEGNGIVWGNLGVDGKAFYISSADDHWNFWFPGQSGCYYTIVDTRKLEWSALYIPSLTVSGDVSGEMVYDKASNTWSLDITTSASSLTVQISGIGAQYNTATQTDDAAAVQTAIGFGQSGDKIVFGESASSITVPVSKSGDVALILNLSDPQNWICEVGDRSEGSTTPDKIWLSGDDDGRTGGWAFNTYLRLYNEEYLNYASAVDFNSLWGYLIYGEKDNWDSSYGAADGGTAEGGSLISGGGGNIPAPSGLYVLDVSLKSLTYSTVPVTDVWQAGLNDNWDLQKMTATSTPGVYTLPVSVTSGGTPWGFKILLDENWSKYFGNTADGNLFFANEGKSIDASYSGDYTLTVNLCTGTWELVR